MVALDNHASDFVDLTRKDKPRQSCSKSISPQFPVACKSRRLWHSWLRSNPKAANNGSNSPGVPLSLL
jgi:hypothetical protein